MKIETLSTVSQFAIFEAFKKSFENYVIPLDIQEEATYRRWKNSSVNFSLSYGAFDESQLVAFILHASYGGTLFNFTTGVVPSHRGLHLIEKISDEVARNIKSHEFYKLEVIKENFKAINLYKKLGFSIKRELISLKGIFSLPLVVKKDLIYNVLPLEYKTELAALRLAEPSMENSQDCLGQSPAFHELHELRENDGLRAYAIYTPETVSLREIGGKSNDDLDQLFLQMKLSNESLRVMNIDSRASDLLKYFESRGVIPFVTQYEMVKSL